MNLLTPQPSQSFWHVGRSGNCYHSGPDRLITPLDLDDEAALRALGCVDAGTSEDVSIDASSDEEELTVDVSDRPAHGVRSVDPEPGDAHEPSAEPAEE